eukprot:10012936-Prorocentrum_lima.AAC.1
MELQDSNNRCTCCASVADYFSSIARPSGTLFQVFSAQHGWTDGSMRKGPSVSAPSKAMTSRA